MTTGKKILLVEDDALISMALGEQFRRWGYTPCEPATTGEEAIRKAAAEQPDMIIMDVCIKGKMNGIETAREISSRSRIPIILMSGYSKSDIQQTADIDCVVEFLSKPVELDDLKNVIESVAAKSCKV